MNILVFVYFLYYLIILSFKECTQKIKEMCLKLLEKDSRLIKCFNNEKKELIRKWSSNQEIDTYGINLKSNEEIELFHHFFNDKKMFSHELKHYLKDKEINKLNNMLNRIRCKIEIIEKNRCWMAVLNNRLYKKLRNELVKNKNKIEPFKLNSKIVEQYAETRNFPSLNSTSKIGPYLRFGTVSIRKIVSGLLSFNDETFLNELIWREFFMQILYHFPHTATNSFKPKYDKIVWLNEPNSLEAWKKGETGFPLVDAGMKELNNTGFMHNRVRMITASFLCKHLLVDWRLGEKYFALKLNDYEMSSNIGNWQWASGSGVDAAPYFRIFNPHTQITKFDKKRVYINRWIDCNSSDYPNEIIDHKSARERCLYTYKRYLD